MVAGAWVARGINAGDRALVRGLLGPSSMAERVSELERTRALAVDDSAAALRRVERDLHDGAQMRLAALAMNLGMAREKLGEENEQPDNATVRELIDAAHRNAVDALADLRDLARGIHPPVLDSGLASALATLATSSAIPASVTADIGPRPAPAIETIAYFCAAELIANATKHSYANQITIKIDTERTGVLRLEVSDDGIGGADAARGSGLAGLAQRVSTVDGRIEVVSPAGGPTTVTVELPLRACERTLMRVVIAEDAALLREGLTRLLEDRGHAICAAVSDGDALLAAVAEHHPDVAVVDIRMPPTHTDEGLRAALQLRQKHPGTGVLMFSQYIETSYSAQLLEGGAAGVGYLLKDRVANVAEFSAALQRVADGGTALDPEVVSQLFRASRQRGGLATLTPRERQVLALMAEGRSNAGIAAELVVSGGAVEKHVASIFSKLGLPPGESDNRRVLAVLRYLGGKPQPQDG